MGSRAISALVFGLCFAIIFTIISFFVPPITKYQCGGKTQTEIFGLMIPGQEKCVGGGSEKSIGWPFATLKEQVPPTLPPTEVGTNIEDSGFELSPAGLIGNLIAYWLVGFGFFFIFSRTRNKHKTK